MPDGAYSIHTYQNVMMTPIVTDTDITEKLLFVSNHYPTREPPITDFHFGDLGEIVVLNLLASLARKELRAASVLLMRQLDDYCWGGFYLL